MAQKTRAAGRAPVAAPKDKGMARGNGSTRRVSPQAPTGSDNNEDLLGLHPAKPEGLQPKFENAPDVFRNRRCWVMWCYEYLNGRWTKVPYQPNGKKASVNNPATWGSLAEVKRAYSQGRFDGVGYCFDGSPVDEDGRNCVGIDLDKMLDRDSGKPLDATDRRIALVASHDGTYCELSPSGTGLHIVALEDYPRPNRKKKERGIEVGSQWHYFTFTGHLYGKTKTTAVLPLEQQLSAVREEIDAGEALSRIESTDQYLPDAEEGPLDYDLDLDDAERAIVQRFRNPKDDAPKKLNRQLWDGDLADYRNRKDDGSPDHSHADAALVGKLARLCSYDANLVDRLFRASGLYRPKWDERRGATTYGQRTVARVLSSLRDKELREDFAQQPESGMPDSGDGWVAQPSKPRPISWLVQNLISKEPHVLMLYGSFGSYKTTVVTSIAMHIGTGRRFAGRHVQQGAVYYIAAEDAAGMAPRTLAQLEAWRQADGLQKPLGELADAFAKSGVLLLRSAGGIQLTDDAAETLAESIRRRIEAGSAPPALIVMDTLTRMLDGDPNSAVDANNFFLRAGAITKEFACPVLVVAHPPKSSGTGNGKHSVAGSQAFGASARGKIYVERANEGGTVTLTSEKVDGAKEGEQMCFLPRVVDLALLLGMELSEGQSYTGVALEHIQHSEVTGGVEELPPVTPADSCKAKRLDAKGYLCFLHNHGPAVTIKDAVTHFQVSERTIERVRKEAKEAGWLKASGLLTPSGRRLVEMAEEAELLGGRHD